MRVTKQQIIKALETEPLAPGEWESDANDPKCKVCAVGAVLRSCGLEKGLGDHGRAATKGFFMDHNPYQLLDQGNFMGALSCYFEGLFEDERSGDVTDTDRRDIIRFVEKNFPDEVEFETVSPQMLGIIDENHNA